VKTCKSLGKGQLDYYATLEELEASWNNTFLVTGTENYTTQGDFDVWIPFGRNPDTDNYELFTINEWFEVTYEPSLNLSGSLLWAPGMPSLMRRDCVACAAGYGCYDEKCNEQKKVHKCKFSELNFMRMQGLCRNTGLGKIKVNPFFTKRSFSTAFFRRFFIASV
jgi:hypothetical protein